MHGHLVAVKVGVKSGTNQRMNLDGCPFNQKRLKGLDAEPMQSGSAVKQNVFVFNNFLQNSPNLVSGFINKMIGSPDIVGQSFINQQRNNKRPKQLQGHMFRQTALMKFKMSTDNNHRPAGIIHSFTQKILPESALFAFKQISQRTEGPALGLAGQGRAVFSNGVVNQGVNRLLKHSFFIAHYDFRRLQVSQFFKTIIAVNHPTIKVINIGGGMPASIQLNHRS